MHVSFLALRVYKWFQSLTQNARQDSIRNREQTYATIIAADCRNYVLVVENTLNGLRSDPDVGAHNLLHINKRQWHWLSPANSNGTLIN